MSTSEDATHAAKAKDEDWSRLEYEELNRYGRTVYETIFRLAQMTFVINPALGAGFYYVFFEKKEMLNKEGLFTDVGVAALAIALLGIVYNVGAYGVYVQSHAFLEALLLRIRSIDKQAGLRMHVALKATAPYSYRRFWGDAVGRRWISADRLTHVFMLVLATSWTMILTYAICRLALPAKNTYLFVAEATTFLVCAAIATYILCLSTQTAEPDEL